MIVKSTYILTRKKIITILILLILTNFNKKNKTYAQKKSNFKVVLDAGHGGKDPGNTGNNYFEKKIALNVTLKVGSLLSKEKDIDIIYTRKKDVYLTLSKRADIANKSKANLFVSIHCNAHNSDAFGAETFVLGLHANNRNFQIAKKENSVIFLEDNYESKYEGFDPNNPESIISLVLMQEDYLNQSIEAASFIQNSFVSNLKRKNRTVKQAGFLVLRNTYMPSVLVELGFLTNKKEGAYLNSKKGQNDMSNAIAKAIINYKKSLSGNLINNSSNESNKIELNNNLPIVYKIQISASTRKIELKSYNFKGLNNLTRTYSSSLYRYYYGEFNTYSEAKSYLSFVKKKGYKGAYIKAFRNGIEININSKMKKD